MCSRLVSAPCLVLAAPLLAGVVVPSPLRAVSHEPQCRGTLLQLLVQEQGQARSERFRFNLRLEAEAASAAAALDQLNSRLDALRQALNPLVQDSLVVSAPSTFPIGSAVPDSRTRAATTISGQVRRSDYDTLIQRAGRLPGVRLQGMTSLASASGQQALEERLLKRALERGQRQADRTASALGLRRTSLLRIDQRSRPPVRALAMAADASSRFRPEEAPLPIGSINLALDYCLS
ncbi:MAG: SIMPL domain-containing protein [Cyanobacteriota bacterium]|nr:SIMPL domain-containing protein [Cyanobacteriota bacterium]